MQGAQETISQQEKAPKEPKRSIQVAISQGKKNSQGEGSQGG